MLELVSLGELHKHSGFIVSRVQKVATWRTDSLRDWKRDRTVQVLFLVCHQHRDFSYSCKLSVFLFLGTQGEWEVSASQNGLFHLGMRLPKHIQSPKNVCTRKGKTWVNILILNLSRCHEVIMLP